MNELYLFITDLPAVIIIVVSFLLAMKVFFKVFPFRQIIKILKK